MDPTRYRKIFLRDYTVEMTIGVYEQSYRQPVAISIDLWLLLENTVSDKDSINDIFDYDYMVTSIQEIAANHVILQETLCDRILTRMLNHPLICAARVSTEKTTIYPNCKGVGVEMFRIK